jgi:FAD dependent oxidoreductase
MSHYTLSSCQLPLDDSWDVIVVGGGPAGCAAGAAAAREGARVLLIEASGVLGGMGTSGLVPAWCPFTDNENFIHHGIARHVFETCSAGMDHVRGKLHGWLPLDPERLKRIYDSLLTDAGATVQFGTMLTSVEMNESGAVDAIITASKSGLKALSAKVYIDCTGDADLCAWAGAEVVSGDASGEVMPSTLCFILSNVDTVAFDKGQRYAGNGSQPGSPMPDILNSGKYPEIKDLHLCCNIIGPGTVGCNAGHLWDVDSTDPASVSRAMMEGRRIADAFRRALAEFDPASFADAYLAATAPAMGIRESRRIVGDYTLTLDDYMARRSFTDEIARNCYIIDIHTAKNEIERNRQGHDVVSERFDDYRPGESHGIPYRTLTPKGIPNLLTAGRAISCDRTVQGSTRVMPVCLSLGEAAGIATALAAKENGDVHAVDIDKVRERLREEGGYLP